MALPALAVSGNQIVSRVSGTPVRLRGINRSGMEYTGPAGIAWTASEFDRIACEWRANIIRLPFNQEWALATATYDPAPYLESLDRAIELAAERGAYTLLTLQWLDNRIPRGYLADGRPNFIPPLPVTSSRELWSQLARRYRDQPCVLFDLLSEPHKAIANDEAASPTERRLTMDDWKYWAGLLITDIREQNPGSLVFVSGINWGYDLKGLPIADAADVVYSTHIYRNKGSNWDNAFGKLAESACVFAGEWGGNDVEWGRKLIAYLENRCIGWTAWGWPDSPPLIDSALCPTRFGSLVRDALAV